MINSSPGLKSSILFQPLDFKNSLLSDNLDLDYVETLIRERFLFGKKNEKIYIIQNNGTKNYMNYYNHKKINEFIASSFSLLQSIGHFEWN